MIFKVTYQPTKNEAPLREITQTIYVEAETGIEVRRAVEKNTPFNIEFIQPLEVAHLEYEQKNEDYKVVQLSELSK